MSNSKAPIITIGDRAIGPGHPAYFIAEMSGNHGHSLGRAMAILRAAKEAGADAIKLQTYTPDTMTIDSSAPAFQIPVGNAWAHRTLYDLYGEASTPWEWQPTLKTAADELGIHCFSTPFDRTAVDFLAPLDMPAYKIASFEAADLPFLDYVARQGKPIIMSTGLTVAGEIDSSLRAMRAAGATEMALLKCTSAYPAPAADMNLRTIPHMAELFGVPTGLSDHTLGWEVAVAAVTLGACIIEKHFTLSRADGGPDAAFSMEPSEFRAMVDSVRNVELALGGVVYEPTARERGNMVFRRSLFVVEDVKTGEPLTDRNVRSIRPGFGLPPAMRDLVLGRRAVRDISRGTPLAWDLIA